MITDVDRGVDGSLFVIQPMEKRVAVYTSAGQFKKWIGSPGGGPGEFLAPTNVAVLADKIIVYDRRLRRISVFDTSGAYRSSFQLLYQNPSSMSVGPGGRLVFTVPQDSFRVVVFDLTGRMIRSLVRAPEIDAQIRGPYLADPGRACMLPNGTLVYANSWTYEIVAYDLTGQISWAKSSPGSLLQPVDVLIPGVSPKTQGGVLLGLECDSTKIVVASFSILSSELNYDVLTSSGQPLARLKFRRTGATTELFPGFLTAMKGDTLMAFRTRPFPQVFLDILHR